MLMINRAGAKTGFTIVELLIVVVVIAILAAITIVAFNGIQNRSKESALRSQASQAAKKLQNHFTLNAETLPTEANFSSATGLSSDSQTTYSYITDAALKKFCVSASGPSGVQYSPQASTSAGNTVNGECTTNIARNAYAVSGAPTNEWYGRFSTNWSWVNGASDGPIGLASYGRQTIVTAVTAASRGFDLNVNLDVTPGASITNWPVAANTPYTVSVYARASVSNPSTTLRCRSHSGGAWVGSQVSSTPVNYVANSWILQSLTYTSPSAAYLACTIRFESSVSWPVGGTMDATGAMITQGTTLYDFAAGNSTGWAWTDTSNTSTSFGPAVRS